MPELFWGNGLEFANENEYYETLGFLCKNENYIRVYIESNDRSGAWAPQGRMQLKGISSDVLPRALKAAFDKSVDGRISETRYVMNLRDNHAFNRESDPTGNNYTKVLQKESIESVQSTVPEQFIQDFNRGLHRNIDLIAHIINNDPHIVNLDEETEHEMPTGQVEGRAREYYTKMYERNAQNRAEAIRIHGTRCMVCGFDFGEKYGELGEGFIEVHHVTPLSSLDEEVVVNPATDLICVCSNCHRMLHRFRDYMVSIEELKDFIDQNQ